MANPQDLMAYGMSGPQAQLMADFFVAKNADSTIASGKTLTVAGTIDSTGTFKINGTAVVATAAEINRVADLSARIVASTDAGTLALVLATHSDKTIYFSDADGAITLPNATGTGAKFKVVLKTAATSMSITVKPSTDEEFMGGVNGVDDDADAAYAWKAEDNDDTISLNGGSTGGKVGDWFEFEDIATGLWLVSGFITQSGGSETTPFSAGITS